MREFLLLQLPWILLQLYRTFQQKRIICRTIYFFEA